MPATTNLGIVYVEQAQSQKELTVNNGFDRIDEAALIFLTHDAHLDSGEEYVLPYASDGTPRTFDLTAIRIRCAGAPSSTLTITANKSTGSGAFSGTSLLDGTAFTITSGVFEGSRTTGFSANTGLTSGTKIKIDLTSSGQTGAKIHLEFKEII
jgi:hypothetical protein